MYEKLNLVSKTRGLESRIKIFLFNKSTMIHPGFVQCNVQTNLAREKDGGGKHIMVERMYVLPGGSITSFNYTAPEGKPRTPSPCYNSPWILLPLIVRR